jgi:hypothetical protein
MTVRFYSSTAAETTLSGTINSSATSITIGSAVGLPASVPFTLALDYESASEELVEVTLLAGTTATVTRAIDGTSATSHTAGARVRHVSSARDFSDSRTHENSDDGVHGLAPGDVIVGEDAVQSLTNKTFTSSTWNGGTITGTIAGTPTFSGAVTLSGGGTLSGTFAGTHTYSGAVSFSGSATHTGLIQSNRTNATDVVLGALYGAFVNDTFRILANGRIEVGPGTGARDTFLYRSGVGALTTDGTLNVGGNLAVTGTSTFTGNVTLAGTINLPSSFNEDTTTRTTASTSFTDASGGAFSSTITVPPSGKVWVHVRSTHRNSSTLNSITSFTASGSTSGTAYSANDNAALINPGSAMGNNNLSLSLSHLLTGLVAGETLTVTSKHRVSSASTMTMDYRSIGLEASGS